MRIAEAAQGTPPAGPGQCTRGAYRSVRHQPTRWFPPTHSTSRMDPATTSCRLLVLAACLLTVAAPALAQTAPADAAACAACHGARGEGMAAFPRLAGTGATYLKEQLDAFASGARQNAIMQPIARALTPQQRAQLAAHFARLPAPAPAADRETTRPQDRGAWLATRGRWSDELPACAQCHGPGGRGVGAQFPPLAGQPAAYLAQQLKAWQDNTRPPGPLDLMRLIARKLDSADIQALSEYYAGLGAAAAPRAAGK